MDLRKKAVSEIVRQLLSGRCDISRVKRIIAKKYHIPNMIRNSEILAQLPKSSLGTELAGKLRKKPTRTLSGITSVAVMIKPDGSCTRGCIYCPFTGKAAKSYTGEEPAALRARQAGFDPYLQAGGRISQLREMGHPTQKCEIILMGGTFLELDKRYKQGFVKGIYDALNGKREKNLPAAIRRNETARHRAVGLTIETRPDVCRQEHIDEILGYGATRVELGVQHPDDRIYSIINRGHNVDDVKIATRLLKDSCFKVLYHIMPGLPGSDRKKDILMVKKLFSDSSFKPDMLKIYPTLVIPGTRLSEMVDKGEFEPYTSEQAAEVIAEFHRHIPNYVRVMRIQRDIPAGLIRSGVKKSNLRQLVDGQITKKGITSQEIRSREIGLIKGKTKGTSGFSLKRTDYEASKGKEIFLSFENRQSIAGFLRLRIPGHSERKEIDDKTGLVRELHVYGQEVPIKEKGKVQHKGIGSSLLAQAESIASQEFERKKMVVISGVGVREYYRKRGYRLLGPYMAKKI